MADLSIVQRNDKLYLMEGDKLLTSYVYLGIWKPYFWPVNAPGGNVVRGIDPADHPNQYGLSLAYGGHGEGASTNIWSDIDEPPYGPDGKELHLHFDALRAESDRFYLAERLVYSKADGSTMCHELREITVLPLPGGELLFEFAQHISPPDDPGPRPFIFYARVADNIRIVVKHGQPPVEHPGEIRNSEGGFDEEDTMQKQARWCDYSGPLAGGWSGITLYDHPGNPDYPTSFATRRYGVFSIAHHYPDGVAPGGVATFRWRAYAHGGNAIDGRVDEKSYEKLSL